MRGNPLSVLITIFKSLSQGEKAVTYGGQKANRKNLKRFQDVDIQPSTYYHHRKTCKNNGWIRARCRYKNGLGGEIRRRTDMVTVPLKGVIVLVKIGIEGARKLRDRYLKGLLPTDQRFPNKKDVVGWTSEEMREYEQLADDHGIVTKRFS